MTHTAQSAIATVLAALALASGAAAAEPDRRVLPLAPPAQPPIVEIDAHKVRPPPLFQVRAPAKAPNVLIILIDDMGFGQSSAFGGPIHMPTVDALARGGLRFNEFHTTGLCAPSRVALLTGRNHHLNNMAVIPEIATSFPGATSIRPASIAPLAEILRLNGYSTSFFGKSHEVPSWEVSGSGPTDRWPTRSGFDKFYGFIGGEANQWAPHLYEDMTEVKLNPDPNYHLMTDLTNHAIDWVHAEKSLTPDRPFFLYFAPGAVHAPHHVPRAWIDKYKGRFDAGWDRLREQTLARQKALGVVPADTELARKPRAIEDWDRLSADQKKLYTRQMEIFAAYGEYADTEIGRLVGAIAEMGQLDNTLIFYIVGDNGASAEGGLNGKFNQLTFNNGVDESVADLLKHYDELGGPTTFNHYAAGWAVAGDTPFTWTKQVASNYGGTRNGMVVHWPAHFKGHGEVRTQWHHLIDIAPTVLEAAGLPEPTIVNGAEQIPMQGTSLLYAIDDARAADRHRLQYFELGGNRAIYADGWLAGVVHRVPWEREPRTTLDNDRWELYDTRHDFSLRQDLAAAQPAKLKAMQALFDEQAKANHVYPIDDRGRERFNAALAGRPDLMAGRRSLTVYPHMTGMNENVFINTKNRSYTMVAEVELGARAHGAILAQGGRFGGYSLYLQDGRPCFTYNWLAIESTTIASQEALPAGKAQIEYRFDYDGGGLGKGGTGILSVDGREVARGRIPRTMPLLYSMDEGADVGADEDTPVSASYASPFEFSGRIARVTITVAPAPAPRAAAEAAAVQQMRIEKAAAD
ncbi:MAG: arylsulfatase [Burkholderiales bacterium]|nr:arylsulfatase [Burkholderiales bacterium]